MKLLLAVLLFLAMAAPVHAAPQFVALDPDPLPHDTSGTILFSGHPDNLWVEVRLEGEGGLLLVSWHHVSAGDVTFTPSPTPGWDGTGGADGFLRLVTFTNTGQRTVANGTFTYLP